MKQTPPRLLTAALLVLTAVWACSPAEQEPPAASAGPAPFVELELWEEGFIIPRQSGSEMGRLHFTVGAQRLFEQQHPNRRIRVHTFPYGEYYQRLFESARSGDLPDLAVMDHIWIAKFADLGALRPLDELLVGETRPEMFFKNTSATCRYRGKVWCVPLTNDGWMELYFNRAHFRDAGLDPDRPPSTWDELLEAARVLTKPPHRYGLALIGARFEATVATLDAFIASNGGRILDESGHRALLDQPAAMEALAFYGRLAGFAPPGTALRTEPEAVRAFITQRASMVLTGAWRQSLFRSHAPGLDWDVALLPSPTGEQPRGTLGGWNLVIFSTSSHAEQAMELIRFLSMKQVQVAFSDTIPARRDAGREFIRKHRQRPDVILEMLEQGVPRPVTPAYPEISDVQQTMVQQVLAGVSAREAAQWATEQLNQLLHSVNP